MSILREKFWILKSRKTVRDVVRRCVRCRRYSSKSPVSDPKRIRYRRRLIEDFRSRFRKEYLGQLRQKLPGKVGNDFKIGDIVIIEELSKKRVFWPLGKVIGLLPGRDGKVRTLKIRCKNSEIIRPIQRVYPLEVPIESNENVKFDGVAASSSSKVNDIVTHNEVIKNKVSRSGRLIKVPERLGLFNNVLYVFE
ncbi:integrase catalytic domain-containing protein [Trichonephila inaurata madagascariensis]|uniref:Integrase catalytic domain-containing protein n=1 Tax=Trichonephila inaurata madagascariensis TaxID=2747483 RepID=A0A8X6ILU3_9ARAC|nr:integrase catalytic domain-containing protein [Trichonephila inaurata madagascariensis]